VQKTSMRRQLNLSYLVISLIVVIAFSAVFYVYTSGVLLNQETERLDTLTEAMMERTEDAIREMDGISVDLIYISQTQKELEKTITEASLTFEESQWQRYQALTDLANLFIAINGANLPVYRVNLFDMAGNCISVGSTKIVSSGLDPTAQSWYGAALAAGGYKTLTHAYLSTSLGTGASRPQYYLSLVRLRLGKNREHIGFVETVQNCRIIFHSVLALNRQKERAYILNEAGELIYPFDGTAAELAQAKALQGGESSDTLARPVYSKYTGWTYIVERSRSAVLQPAMTLLQLVLGLSLVMLVIIALYATIASRRITRPLLALADHMNAMDVHTLELTHSTEQGKGGYQEIDRLNESFEQMRRQLNASLNQLIVTKQQALQSRNLAMQAQINPHFYFNTLSNIIALTDAQRSDDVITMCRSLTGMMRYITISDPMTTMHEELRYVRQYLYCMQMRYENNFSFTIDVPQTLMNEPMPRLIIQPLVENAIKYGMDSAPPWKLQIVGESVPDCWRIWVADNGTGFTEKALRTIREGMQTFDETAEMPASQIGGMGLLNVYARWKLFAGENALFEISTKLYGGYVMIGMERR
jgi:two-component system, sensor histidine kinase YesM